MLKRCKPSDFRASKNIPDNRSLSYIVADNQSTSATLAHIIHRNKLDIFLVASEAALHGQGIMMKT